MTKDTLRPLLAFMAVARERSFTRAAARLGVSQSALSHTMRALESSLGVRLLTRTTRSVAPTQAGEQLLRTLVPRMEEIEGALGALGSPDAPGNGTVRIRSTDYAADTVLRPRLASLLAAHPALKVELTIDDGPDEQTDDQYDLGVRWGDQVAKDRVAVRIAEDCRMVIVGAPGYLATRPPCKVPQDLIAHNSITLRRTDGNIAAWDLVRGRKTTSVRLEGQAVFNGLYPAVTAALSGCGLAFIPVDLVDAHLRTGRLSQVLDDWSPTVPGLHLYMAKRLSNVRIVALVVDSLRYRR
jgi:DNA-binding transcriptional LysR family regulator